MLSILELAAEGGKWKRGRKQGRKQNKQKFNASLKPRCPAENGDIVHL